MLEGSCAYFQVTDVGLTSVKIKFTEITQQQITQFKTELEEFAEKFHESGPGAVGADLDHGLKILNQFKKDMLKYENERLVCDLCKNVFM